MRNPAAQSNLLRYSQHHFSSSDNDKLANTLGVKSDAGCDGIAHFWAESVEKLLAVFDTDYYRSTVVPDEAKFIDREKTTMVIGVDDDKWADGKAGERVTL